MASKFCRAEKKSKFITAKNVVALSGSEKMPKEKIETVKSVKNKARRHLESLLQSCNDCSRKLRRNGRTSEAGVLKHFAKEIEDKLKLWK